jgi:hypothetical protein
MRRTVVQGVEFFARLEANSLSRRDTDFSTGPRVAADSGFTRTDAEDAESPQFNAITGCQSLFEALEDGVHGSFRLGPRQACPLDNVMDDILLDQCPSPLIEENLAPIRSGRPERPTGEMLLGVGDVVNLRVLQYHKQLRGLTLQ